MGKRPGYKRNPPLYRLNFEAEEFEGLEVMTKSVSMNEFFEFQTLQERAQTDPEAQKEIMRRLCGVIVSWNLEDDEDQPVPVQFAVCVESGKPGNPGDPCSHHQNEEGHAPCEYTGLIAYDLPFVLAIFFAWMEAISNIPNLSSKTSSDGETSLAQSIPMEVS